MLYAFSQVVRHAPSLFTVPQNILVSQFNKLSAFYGDANKEEVLVRVSRNPKLLGIDGL